jgi:hypothetical protein
MPVTASSSHFQQLLNTDPQEICSRIPCCYDNASGTYSLTTWGVEYSIDPAGERISAVNPDQSLHEYFVIFLIHYLLNDKEIHTFGEWISEKDMTGGPTFFRGPHAIPTEWISERFGNDLGSFKQFCTKHSGDPLDMADAAFSFALTPNIRVAVLYWTGDEDFPAEVKILYDSSLPEYFALDVVYALAVAVCDRFILKG